MISILALASDGLMLGFTASFLAIPEDISFFGGIGLAVLGLFLRWSLPHQQMLAEEHAKERRWSEDQVRRRVRLFRFGGATAIVVAALLFSLVLWN